MKYLMIFFLACIILSPAFSSAARMGGGKSFGSRPFMSQPAPAPRQMTTQPKRENSFAQSQQAPSRGFGSGLIGGLLAGTLLGSLLGGAGFSGGGFMDLILLGILAFICFKLFQKFRSRQMPETEPAGHGTMFQNNSNPDFGNNTGWNMLKNSPSAMSQANPVADIPPDFNEEEFLKGARLCYNRMQKSWDKRDLSDISQFATESVMDVLKEQLKTDSTPSNTEIMQVNAQLIGVEQEGADERAQVYFETLMRESANQNVPETVREIWHFLRIGSNGMWKLDGIQQVN